MLTMTIYIDVTDAQQGRFRVTYHCHADEALPSFVFEAPYVHNGILCSPLRVMDEHDQPLPYTRNSNKFLIHAQDASFSYTLQTQYHACVGADRKVNFVYPFVNEHELFLGSGALPYPSGDFVGEVSTTLTLVGLPDDWHVFSNMQLHTPSRSTLHGFFLYASAALRVSSFRADSCTFHFAAQYPTVDIDALWDYASTVLQWMNRMLVPYQPPDAVKVLILQALDSFEMLANNKTFATGENFFGGIISYGPRNSKYLRKLFGYDSYDQFLKDGLVHELFHFYASSNPLSAEKSLLYPSPDCDPYTASLLGESLIGYLHRQYVALATTQSPEAFLNAEVVKPLTAKGISRMASWFVFDVYLREHGSSLVAAFRQWLVQQAHRPFTTLDEFLQVIVAITREPIPTHLHALLWKQPPDQHKYVVEAALRQAGYDLIVSQAGYSITSLAEAAIIFDLPDATR